MRNRYRAQTRSDGTHGKSSFTFLRRKNIRGRVSFCLIPTFISISHRIINSEILRNTHTNEYMHIEYI
jgi:hypothetical protein